MNEQQQFYFSNAINMLSLALGFENLQENRAQSKHNDIHDANDKQAEYLLAEIKTLFDDQNKTLEKQNQMLDILLDSIKN